MTTIVTIRPHGHNAEVVISQIIDGEERASVCMLDPHGVNEFSVYDTKTILVRETDGWAREGEPLRFGFGEAIRALKDGRAVTRSGWNGKGMFICLMPSLQLPPFNTQGTDRKVNDRTAKWIGEDAPLDCQPYIAMYTAAKQWQPGWLASQADMLADDWMLV